MRPLLAWIIICHWAVLFVLLAAVSALDPARGPLAVFELMGATAMETATVELNPLLAGLAACAIASTALLFLWALMSVAFAEGKMLDDGVVSLAFAAGAGLLGLGWLAGFLLPVQGHALPLAAYLLALVASYLAIAIPAPAGSGRSDGPGASESRMAARMATFGQAQSIRLAQTEEIG